MPPKPFNRCQSLPLETAHRHDQTIYAPAARPLVLSPARRSAHARSPSAALRASALRTPHVITDPLMPFTRALRWPNFSRALHYPPPCLTGIATCA
jgi:hypothetical protein